MKLHDNPLFHIFHISKSVERIVQTTILKECGVSYADTQVLMIVGTHPDITQQGIAEALMVSAPAVSRQLDRLEKEGYLSRIDNPHNRRTSKIMLTKKGVTMQKKVAKYLDTLVGTILRDTGGLTKATITNLQSMSLALSGDDCMYKKNNH